MQKLQLSPDRSSSPARDRFTPGVAGKAGKAFTIQQVSVAALHSVVARRAVLVFNRDSTLTFLVAV